MTVVKHVKRGPWSGNKHPMVATDDLPPPKPGTRRVEIPMHSSCSGVSAKMPVTLPAWPESWRDDAGAGE